MDFTALFSKILVFIVMIFIGYMFSRKNFLTAEFNKSTSKLLINVFIPASILNSVLSGHPDISMGQFWEITLILLLTTVIGYLIAYIYVRIRKKGGDPALVEMVIAVTNTLFVGLPILNAAYGNDASFYVGLSSIPFNLVLYSYGVWRLKDGKGGSALKEMLNPCLIAAVISVVVFVINPPIPRIVSDFMGTVSSAVIPLSMVLIGSTMGKSSIAGELKDPETWVITAIRLVLCPLVTYFAVSLLTDNAVLIAVCTILGGCPTGLVMTALSLQYGHDADYSSKKITITTLLSIIVLPLYLMILAGMA